MAPRWRTNSQFSRDEPKKLNVLVFKFVENVTALAQSSCVLMFVPKTKETRKPRVLIAVTLRIISVSSSWEIAHCLPFTLLKQTKRLCCLPLWGWLICSTSPADGFSLIKFGFFFFLFSFLLISYEGKNALQTFWPVWLVSFFYLLLNCPPVVFFTDSCVHSMAELSLCHSEQDQLKTSHWEVWGSNSWIVLEDSPVVRCHAPVCRGSACHQY